MPRPYAVKPQLRPGKATYSAVFYNARGEHKTGSLRTQDHDAAKLICQGLVSLRNAKCSSLETIPAGIPPESVKIYFGITDANDGKTTGEFHGAEADVSESASFKAELARFPQDAWLPARLLLLEKFRLKGELENAHTAYTKLNNDHEGLKKEFEALRQSVVARVSDAGKNLPTIEAALDLFKSTLSTTTSRDNVKTTVGLAKRFVCTLPANVRNIADVRPDHVNRFLDEETARTNPDKPLARRRNLHIRLARFLNWHAQRYELPSAMSGVKAVKRDNLRRERGEIVWHDLKDVEAAIESIKPADGKEPAHVRECTYWRALLAMLAYAGPQLAELCWLRRSDLSLSKDGGTIWIGPVNDPTHPGAQHLLKTGNRERHVNVHAKYLLPRLREYLDAGLAGQVFLFPKIARRNRTRTVNIGHAERWIEDVLGTKLRGHPGGKKRKPTAGILPAGMNAATLRHTFGSLLLRSGKTYAQVAAAMGNTEQTVREHYARLKGSETPIDF